jgi:hypothetical protein
MPESLEAADKCVCLGLSLDNLPTNSVELSPCEEDSHSADLEISRLLMIPKLYCSIHKSPQLNHIYLFTGYGLLTSI